MKLINVFLIWLWANLMLAFCTVLYSTYVNLSVTNGIGNAFAYMVYGFFFTIPSLVALVIFQYVYSSNKKSITNNLFPYLKVVLGINFTYFLIYLIGGGYNEIRGIFFFIFTTICGVLAFCIEYSRVIANKKSIEKEQTQIKEIQ